jgi:uncharacterized protein YkwD
MTGNTRKRNRSSAFILVCVLAAGSLCTGSAFAQPTPGDCLSADEATLVQLVNDYRQAEGLAPLEVTVSLTTVAQWHVWDLDINHPQGGECNLHSWSDGPIWTPVCYTADHANASGMWDKPREITANAYSGNGFEIAYWTSGTATPEAALSAWQNSPGHNDVILNVGIWQAYDPWPAMGVGMSAGYAVIWFGNTSDPQGTINECGSTPSSQTSWTAIKSFYRTGGSGKS